MATLKPKKPQANKTVNPSTTVTVVNQEIQIRSVDRTPKDIGVWRRAHQAAENVASPQRNRLYDVYADVELDGHLTGIMGKRIDAVLNKTWHYLDAGGQKVDAMDETIESETFRGVMKLVMLQMFWGSKGMEFIPGPTLAYQEIPVKNIRPELGLITLDQNGNTGIPYADVPNIWVLGDKNDLGLFLKCAPYAIFKKGNFSDWAQFVEIYGQPIRVMKYNLHDLEAKEALKATLDESGSSLAIMIPEGVEFDIKDGKSSNGDGKLQDTFKDALNAELSVIVLGNTETTTNGKTGTGAKSKEHGKQQLEVTKSDMKLMTNALNHPKFIDVLRSYGLPVVDKGKFATQRELDMEVLQDRVDIDTKVAEQVPIEDEYWYETYGIPKPKNYEALKQLQLERAQLRPKGPGKGKAGDQGEEELFTNSKLSMMARLRLLASVFS